MYAYYDPDATAWLPTGESDDLVIERVPHGLHDLDRARRQLVGIEIWAASTAYRQPLSKPCQGHLGQRFQDWARRRLRLMSYGAECPRQACRR